MSYSRKKYVIIIMLHFPYSCGYSEDSETLATNIRTWVRIGVGLDCGISGIETSV